MSDSIKRTLSGVYSKLSNFSKYLSSSRSSKSLDQDNGSVGDIVGDIDAVDDIYAISKTKYNNSNAIRNIRYNNNLYDIESEFNPINC